MAGLGGCDYCKPLSHKDHELYGKRDWTKGGCWPSEPQVFNLTMQKGETEASCDKHAGCSMSVCICPSLTRGIDTSSMVLAESLAFGPLCRQLRQALREGKESEEGPGTRDRLLLPSAALKQTACFLCLQVLGTAHEEFFSLLLFLLIKFPQNPLKNFNKKCKNQQKCSKAFPVIK